MYETFREIGVVVWITFLIIWFLWISASVSNHNERLKQIEKRNNREDGI